MTPAHGPAVRGRYVLEGYLGDRTVDFWYQPPQYWHVEIVGHGPVFIASPGQIRARMDEGFMVNEAQLLPDPARFAREILDARLGVTDATLSAAAPVPLLAADGEPVGSLTIDQDSGFVTGFTIDQGRGQTSMRTESLAYASSWDPDLFVWSGWGDDAPTPGPE
ncbi:hypothetical protein [Nonomuraea sp. NPDC050310]|uniref:hypothetical protein n=1 Tax=Nonomuraea sp. NPDC050310 TaxID=3154935 RepID=UPI0033D5120E